MMIFKLTCIFIGGIICAYKHILMDGFMDEIFKVLGDPTRLRIIQMLAENGEVCVCRIVEELGMNQPAISQHMAKLKQVKLLHSRKQGQWIHYSLNVETVSDGPLTFLLNIVDSAKKAQTASCC